MTDVAEAEAGLRERLRGHPADRYPVQHATTRFHLATMMLSVGRAGEAVAHLVRAAKLFGDATMTAEHAKAMMMLGVALRDEGQLSSAREALVTAGDALDIAGLPVERAAVEHNLGLVARDSGDLDEAARHFSAASERFAGTVERTSYAAAEREFGAVLLAAGRSEEAIVPLQRARDEAAARMDGVALAAAANTLGLAHLALSAADAAVEAFTMAVAASPRGLRPEAHAMARANLALAYEAVGDTARARLAVRAARSVTLAPEPVRALLDDLVVRLGECDSDLLAVLDREDDQACVVLMRDEVAHLAAVGADPGSNATTAWVRGVIARAERAHELSFMWFDAALELPGADMERVVGLLIQGWAEVDAAERERFRAITARVLPRFHLPQWQRLEAVVERASTQAGFAVAWR